MKKRTQYILAAFLVVLSACGMVQSIVKSSFPYTAILVIPETADVGKSYAAVSVAKSFDQNFSINGNNGSNVSEVSIISAKLESIDPPDFNLGNLKSVKIYMAKEDGGDEALVASNTNIDPAAGNLMTLNIDNSTFLDQLVRQAGIRVKMIYELRKKARTNTSLRVVLGLNAYPAGKK